MSLLSSIAENWTLKLLSLAFAIGLWLFVIGERRLEVGYTIPLELKNVPQGLMVANEIPNLVDVRISGPRTLLMSLGRNDVSISVDLKDLQPGVTSFKRLEERLNIPSGLRVTRLSPSYVDIKLERIKDKTVPIRPVLEGAPEEGFLVEKVLTKPTKVEVEGAESELKDLAEVVTEPIDLTGVRESFTLMSPLVIEGKYTRLKDLKAVEVRVEIKPAPSPPKNSEPKAGKKGNG